MPFIIDEDLPIGGEENNKTLRKWGDIKEFEFTPKDHVELGEKLSGIDEKMIHRSFNNIYE